MELLEVLQNRRSIRKYTKETISKEKIETILRAGLLSASSRAIRPWELIVVKDKEVLKSLSGCRVGSAKMLENAEVAIVVIADQNKSDVWVEDCSIVMSNMHLMAESLGVGSCWIQGRLRKAPNGQTTEEYVREILNFPPEFCLEAILSLGIPAEHPERTELSGLKYQKIHFEKFGCVE